MNDPARRLEAKLFYRKLDGLFSGMDPNRPHEDLLKSFLEESFRILRDHLHLKACLYYEEEEEIFVLKQAAGEPVAGPETQTGSLRQQAAGAVPTQGLHL